MTEITHAGFVVKLSEELTADEKKILREYLTEIRRVRDMDEGYEGYDNNNAGTYLCLWTGHGECKYPGYERQDPQKSSPEGWTHFPEAGPRWGGEVAEYGVLIRNGRIVRKTPIDPVMTIVTGVMPVLRTAHFV